MNKHFTFSETMWLDSQLYQLAAYDVTKGFIMSCKTIDEEMQYKERIVDRFNRFKACVQKGEYTVGQLRDMTLSKYGPYYQQKITEEQQFRQLEDLANSPLLEESDEEDGLPSLFNFLKAPSDSKDNEFQEEKEGKLDDTFQNIIDSLIGDRKQIKKSFDKLPKETKTETPEPQKNESKENKTKSNPKDELNGKTNKKGSKDSK